MNATGAKAQSPFVALSARLKSCLDASCCFHGIVQVAQVTENSSIPSGAKARIDFAGLMYGLKPVPFKTSTYSEAL
jgi:hypothetical protein